MEVGSSIPVGRYEDLPLLTNLTNLVVSHLPSPTTSIIPLLSLSSNTTLLPLLVPLPPHNPLALSPTHNMLMPTLQKYRYLEDGKRDREKRIITRFRSLSRCRSSLRLSSLELSWGVCVGERRREEEGTRRRIFRRKVGEVSCKG